MTPKQQAPVLETCKLLKEAGWKQGSTLFSWAYDNLKYGKEFTHEVVKIINTKNPVENMHRIVAHPDSAANGRAETSRNGNVPRNISTAIQVRSDSHPDRERQQQSKGAFRKVKRRAVNGSAFSAADTESTIAQNTVPSWSGRERFTGGDNTGTWYEVAARFCRMDDGLSPWIYQHRQQRLKALGNAIVPQVAEEIFRAIKTIDNTP